MLTPYDWQEGIGNRAQYIEAKLEQGAPVIALSIEEGILFFTYRRQGRKIFEIYDRLIFSGIGQQSDVEAVRVAALEFASREAFARSDDDVTIQRVATAVSTPLKRAFNDFNSAPFVVRGLFAEVSEDPTKDEYYAIDYDGEYTVSNGWGVVAGTSGVSESIGTRLGKEAKNLATDQAVATLRELYISETRKEGVSDDDRWRGFNAEAVLLERARAREDRFRILSIS
jgi:proteasome alpha subunit